MDSYSCADPYPKTKQSSTRDSSNVPIDNNASRSSFFVVVHNQYDCLVKDTSQFFVGNQDASWFDVFDFVRPTMLVYRSIRFWLDVNGELVG